MQNIRAEIVLPTGDLKEDIPFFTKTLGFRMDEIFPADDPRVGVFTGFGLRLRIDRDYAGAPGMIRLRCDDPMLIAGGKTDLTAPNGTQVQIVPGDPPLVMPPVLHEFSVRHLADKAAWVVGRAGMEYRDLIPSRLGGSIIASHIRIPGGGPVPDMVHYHSVGFQLIFCYKGWVDLVYEDQGPPFRLYAGNCVIQPPEIRHRVLYASADLEVIEIGVPAEHITTLDHDMELPTKAYRPKRPFDGQTFVHHDATKAPWGASRLAGFEAQDTGIRTNTGGVADVQVLRPATGDAEWAAHHADIHFAFVMAGRVTLQALGGGSQDLVQGDAFVTPPNLETRLTDASDDLAVLDVLLAGD